MRVKTKSIITALMFAALIGLLALFIVVVPQGATTASAATTPKCVAEFGYTYKYTSGTGGGVSTSTSGNPSAYSATFTSGNNQSTTMTVYIYGSNVSGTGTFANGGYIGSKDVTIEITSTKAKISVSVKNESGVSVGSGANKAVMTGLSDGTYTVTMTYSNAWTINSRAGASCSFTGSFSFKIDDQRRKHFQNGNI